MAARQTLALQSICVEWGPSWVNWPSGWSRTVAIWEQLVGTFMHHLKTLVSRNRIVIWESGGGLSTVELRWSKLIFEKDFSQRIYKNIEIFFSQHCDDFFALFRVLFVFSSVPLLISYLIMREGKGYEGVALDAWWRVDIWFGLRLPNLAFPHSSYRRIRRHFVNSLFPKGHASSLRLVPDVANWKYHSNLASSGQRIPEAGFLNTQRSNKWTG